MNIEQRSRRRLKRAVCVITFFVLGGIVGHYLPSARAREAREEPSKIMIVTRQPLKVLRLDELKIETSRIGGNRYRVHLTMNIEIDEAMLPPLFDQFKVEGGDAK